MTLPRMGTDALGRGEGTAEEYKEGYEAGGRLIVREAQRLLVGRLEARAVVAPRHTLDVALLVVACGRKYGIGRVVYEELR